jgi:predicted RNA-binding Zn ribbon-like protein
VGRVGRKRGFELRGGAPCLDFVNTVGWRLTDRPTDYLSSYEDLLAWAGRAGLLSSDEAVPLSDGAATDPEGARAVMSRAIALREALHRVLSAATADEPPDEDAMSVLNRELSVALSRLRVGLAPGGAWVWAWDGDGGSPLERPLWPVARSAAELLTSSKLGRVKVCAGEGCGWMFLDESRNGSRRWCDSRDCGNRERVRRHLARRRASRS